MRVNSVGMSCCRRGEKRSKTLRVNDRRPRGAIFVRDGSDVYYCIAFFVLARNSTIVYNFRQTVDVERLVDGRALEI